MQAMGVRHIEEWSLSPSAHQRTEAVPITVLSPMVNDEACISSCYFPRLLLASTCHAHSRLQTDTCHLNTLQVNDDLTKLPLRVRAEWWAEVTMLLVLLLLVLPVLLLPVLTLVSGGLRG